jgi:hypothetical protein
MRRHRLLLVLGVCALLLTPSAGGGPLIPGDPTPPVVTPHFFGTMGLNGWWVSNVTLNWTVEDPESPILETRGCDAVTLNTDPGHGHDPARQDRAGRHRHAVAVARLARLVQPRPLGQL